MNQESGCGQRSGLTETAMRAHVRQAEIDGSPDHSGALTAAEREELTQLRQRVKTLERERDMLQEATAFFATQSAQSSDLWRCQRRAIRWR
jgi:transposase